MDFWGNILLESLCDNIGRTVTIFTTSGGISGGGVFLGLMHNILIRNKTRREMLRFIVSLAI